MYKIKSIHDYHVGDKEELVHTITMDDVEKFSKLTGDYNPLHLDFEFAEQTDFRRPVVFGMLSASFISTIIGMKIPGPGALWTSQTLEFLHQVYVGDTLNIQACVTQVSVAANTLVLDIVVKNQHGYDVIKGEANVQILKVNKEVEENKYAIRPVCLITGGTSDIGRAIAARLVDAGYEVVINYRGNVDKANNMLRVLGEKGNIHIEKADLSSEDEVCNMIENVRRHVGEITSIVHCAAPYNLIKNFDNVNWNDVQKHLDVQVKGLFYCLQKILPSWLKSNLPGRVVAIGSSAVDNVPPALQYDYIVAKSALSALVKSLAVEYSPKGIAFSMVSPGMTETERIMDLPQKAKLMTKMQNPSRALVLPDEVAEAVLFLIQQKSCVMTGENIRVNGGYHMI